MVIGAGNAGMDVCLGAYAMGAKKVVSIDVQRPAAYKHEIDHVKALGGEIRWPVFTEKIDREGGLTKDGELIEADTVIIAIGERPDLSYVPREWLTDKGMMDVDDCWQVVKAPGVFAIGDTIKPGLLTHAIGAGAGRRPANRRLTSPARTLVPIKKPEMIPQSCLSKELFKPAEPRPLLRHRRQGRDQPLSLLRHLPRLLDVPGGLPGRGDPPGGEGGRRLRVRLRRSPLHRLRHLRGDLPLRDMGHGAGGVGEGRLKCRHLLRCSRPQSLRRSCRYTSLLRA